MRGAADKCTCAENAPCSHCVRKLLVALLAVLPRPVPPPEPRYHCPIIPYCANAIIEPSRTAMFSLVAPTMTLVRDHEWSVIFENKTAEMVFRWAAEQFWTHRKVGIRAVISVERDDDTGLVILWSERGRLAIPPLDGEEIPLPIPGPPRPHPSYAQPYWPKGRRVEA